VFIIEARSSAVPSAARHPHSVSGFMRWRSYSARALLLGAPALLTLLMGGIDIALAFKQMAALDNAAKAGVRYAVHFPSRPRGVFDAVKASVPMSAPTVVVRSTVHCECPDVGNNVACEGSAKSCGGEPADTFRTVTVIVSMPYSSPLPTSSLIRTTALSRSATFRVH
jgi:hypothetical protein